MVSFFCAVEYMFFKCSLNYFGGFYVLLEIRNISLQIEFVSKGIWTLDSNGGGPPNSDCSYRGTIYADPTVLMSSCGGGSVPTTMSSSVSVKIGFCFQNWEVNENCDVLFRCGTSVDLFRHLVRSIMCMLIIYSKSRNLHIFSEYPRSRPRGRYTLLVRVRIRFVLSTPEART